MLRTLIALAGLLIFNSSLATTVLPVSLERLADKAEVIFYGRVISNEVRLDDVSQRIATFTTFTVIDAIKGELTDTYTIKQIGGQLPGSLQVTRVHGVPEFSENEEYVVFLPKESRLGFSSPIGLNQGSYPVSTDASGKTVRYYGAENKPATNAATTQTAHAHNKTDLADFLQHVRALSGH